MKIRFEWRKKCGGIKEVYTNMKIHIVRDCFVGWNGWFIKPIGWASTKDVMAYLRREVLKL